MVSLIFIVPLVHVSAAEDYFYEEVGEVFIDENNIIESGDFVFKILEEGKLELMYYSGESYYVDIPNLIYKDGIKYCIVSIGDYAFSGCVSIGLIGLRDTIVNICDNAFVGLENFSIMGYSDTYAEIYAKKHDIRFEEYYEKTERLIYDNLICEINGQNASVIKFIGQEENVVIPSKVNEHEIMSIDEFAFRGNEYIKKIIMPYSIREIGIGAFADCKNLIDITFSPNIFRFGNAAFSETKWLENQREKNDFVIVNNIIVDARNARGDVVIPDDVVAVSDFAFYGSKIESLKMNNNLKTLWNCAFCDCANLKSIDFSKNLETIEYSAFSGCILLQEVSLPNSLKSIGSFSFCACKDLKKVYIPQGVENIYYHAFSGCDNLKEIMIPQNVTNIDSQAFGYVYDNGTTNDIIPGVKIYGYKGTAAEKYAKENGIKFIEMSDFIEKADEDTGVSISLPEDLTLRVNDATDSDSVKSIVLTDNETLLKAFDITLLKNGAATQPDGSVTVKIPCDNSKAKVYRVESDKTLTDMNAVYQDGYLVFTTDHFSVYVVTEPKTVLIGDVNDDGKVNGADAGLLNRYTSGWEGYAEKIKNMDAADINRDGKVNGADSGLLNRYTSGWETVKKYFTTV